MWRVSSMAMRPKRAGTRRCWKDTTRAFSAIHTAQSQTQKRAAASTSIIIQQKKQPLNSLNYQRSRYFHASPFVGAKPSWELDNDDDIDPDDPDDIPDFLDDEDFASSLRDIPEQNDEADGEEEREKYRLQQEKVNDELDNRKGRPWRDPWEISEQQWMSSDTSSESLPDWSPTFVSRISLERLQVLPIGEDGTGGIPTLQRIAELSLPGSDPGLHPAVKTKTYAAYRKSQHYSEVRDCVERLAKARVATLLKAASSGGGEDTHNQQDVVDALFEDLQKEAKVDAAMDILSKHPTFPDWVDRGLEEYLRKAENEALLSASASTEQSSDEKNKEEITKDGESSSSSKDEKKVAASGNNEEKGDGKDADPKSLSSFREATPVFMDCYDPTEASADGSSTSPTVPSILTPLGPHRHGGPGRMVEEWELSAHSTTKRIMLRECTQKVAGILAANEAAAAAPKIYVHGRQGVGKTAVLASIVASSRTSGYIVLYLPDGDRLRKNGFFITPSSHPDRKGIFDLQDLSQEALKQLVGSYDAAEQMEGMIADRMTLEVYFKDTQFKRLDEYRAGLDGAKDENDDDGSISLLDLIAYSQENKKHAPMCYSVVVNRLMHQTDKKFMIVMDEFNCLFDKGHYFHMAYDENVREPIPYDKISLFEPIMAAMDLTTKTVEEEEDSETGEGEAATTSSNTSFTTSNTAMLVGTSESHAIRSDVNSKLTECAERRTTVEVIEVPRFSSLEADHVLANFEATGVGKLRLDRGDTLMNPQEMEYLKMASGSIGQKLLDVSIF